MRAEQQWWSSNASVKRLTKKLLHCWAQHVEVGVEESMRLKCPDPTLETRNHPFTVASRRKGSKALQLALIQRFTCKGGGFVSTKNELTLSALGVVQKGSTLGSRTSSEYVARALVATCGFCTEYIASARLKVINFAMDAASIGGEHAPRKCFKFLTGFRGKTCRIYNPYCKYTKIRINRYIRNIIIDKITGKYDEICMYL